LNTASLSCLAGSQARPQAYWGLALEEMDLRVQELKAEKSRELKDPSLPSLLCSAARPPRASLAWDSL
jgi:hypothetical protein